MAMIRGKKSKIQIILIVVSLIFLVAFIVLLSNLYGCGDMVNVPYTNSTGSNIEEDLKT